MAPSHMEHQQEQTLGQGYYTHKKFNCGYSHKKLGLRLRKREQDLEVNTTIPSQAEDVKSNKPNKAIFRPYALDEINTPRKRKLSKSLESSANAVQTAPTATNLQYDHHQQQQQQQNYLNLAINVPGPTVITSAESCDYASLSPNSYNMRLQRQRAALYIRYMAQIQQSNFAATYTSSVYPVGYPNVTAPLFNGC